MVTHATPLFLVLSSVCPLLAAPPVVTVHADQPVHPIPPSLWGVFLEEVNHACESGLYAELLRNRRFREPPANNDPIPGWNAPGRPSIIIRDNLGLTWTPAAGESLVNSGFWGVPVLPHSSYTLRIDTGALTGDGRLQASLRSETGETLASQSLTLTPNATCSVTLAPANLAGPRPHGTLVLTALAAGSIQLRMVSLFPPTYRDHPNGLRPDLATLVENLHPAFVWPDTIGDVAARPGHRNAIWEYWSSDGLGYHEYLQLCEDLHADPLYVFNCGLSHKEAVPLDQLQPWIDEAIHSIDYANAPADSPMGALRAKNGHPAPFNLKYAEIGNEIGMFNDFGGTHQQYAERYRAFESQLKKHHPSVLTVADTRIDAPADLVDDHYYNSVAWFWQNQHLYDKTPRTGPRIYVGEYAVTQGCGLGNLDAALAEAAFMIGLERNSDLVTMASYAPMFVRAEDRKWNPAMMVFDGTRSLGTPSYYVQAMFAHSRADTLLACDLPEFPSRPVLTAGSIGVGTWPTTSR